MSTWPRISIVTANLNGAKYLEATIRSIVTQEYPNVEYIVIDGGSSDCSLDIIEKYERHLSYWVSEADQGHAHALNKGFAHASGEIMGWINSDDWLLPGSLWTLAEVFGSYHDIEWLTSALPAVGDHLGRERYLAYPGFSKRFFELGGYGGQSYSTAWIQQESTFWRRSLWDRTGGRVDESLSLAVDFELWARFFRHAKLASVEAPLGCFRVHAGQRSTAAYDCYRREASRCIHGRRSSSLAILATLWHAVKLYKVVEWKRMMALLYGEDVVRVSKSHDGRWRRYVCRAA